MGNKSNLLFLLLGLILGGLVMHFCSNYTITEKQKTSNNSTVSYTTDEQKSRDTSGKPNTTIENSDDIRARTDEDYVATYIKENHRLPDYYITKSEARKRGWEPSAGNLCDVLPGMAIGGDKFSNREKQLPAGAQYFEADINYACGNRGADRLVFTKEGEVWVTHNHYKTFEKK